MKFTFSILAAIMLPMLALADGFNGGGATQGGNNNFTGNNTISGPLNITGLVSGVVTNSANVIPVGVTFWDDFKRTNTSPGFITPAPSISPVTGSNYVWFPGAIAANTGGSNYFINNGGLVYNDYGSNGPVAYPTVDVGFRPTYVGARLHYKTNGLGGNAIQGMTIICSTNSGVAGQGNNGIDQAFHFTFYPYAGSVICIAPGLWATGNGLPIVGNLTSILPYPQSGQSFNVEFWVDGNTITFDVAGQTTTMTDPRFSSFGGRFVTWEFYDTGGFTNAIYDLTLEAVWAGGNPRPSIPSWPIAGGGNFTDGIIPSASGNYSPVGGIGNGTGNATIIHVANSGFYTGMSVQVNSNSGLSSNGTNGAFALYTIASNGVPANLVCLTTNYPTSTMSGFAKVGFGQPVYIPAGLYWGLSAYNTTSGYYLVSGGPFDIYAPSVIGQNVCAAISYTAGTNPQTTLANASGFTFTTTITGINSNWVLMGVAY